MIRPVLLLAFGLALLGPASAALPERELVIAGPSRALPDSEVAVTVHVITRVGGDERIGFLHAEYSVDGGAHWTAFAYDQNIGSEATRQVAIRSGAAHSRVLVRVRVAFRDGAAGDVDYTGAAIRWAANWSTWDEPPARRFVIEVE
jgi:hypothetical protein